VVVHATGRSIADRADFVAPLRDATGVWISGGSPSRLSDIYWQPYAVLRSGDSFVLKPRRVDRQRGSRDGLFQ
jgi:hypothetical protein